LQSFCKTITEFIEYVESLILRVLIKLNESNTCSGFV